MKKGDISNWLRNFGLIYYTDYLRFNIEKAVHRSSNATFKKNNPNIVFPADYLMYESFKMNYKAYYESGKQTAEWLIGHFSKYYDLENATILDWGCGPGRVIRHLPNFLPKATVLGTDYNEESINWCKKNLNKISFNQNSLIAELPYSSNSVDVLYGISIFTHLSEEMHYAWYKELYRILKPGGLMLLTTQGVEFKPKLTSSEINTFDKGNLVVRGKVKEGHRTFSAFHPNLFMKKLFYGAEVLEHIVLPAEGQYIPQDVWIIRKNK